MLKSRLPEIAFALRHVLNEAMEQGADDIADSARQRVPRDTGALAEAIHVESEREGVYVIAGDSGVFYGHMVEHGTSKTPPRPFLIPALEANRAKVIARAQAVLKAL